jgi:hypothetical protein
MVFLAISPLAFALPHAEYASFASPQQRVSFESDILTITDSIIYGMGYYSINGSRFSSFIEKHPPCFPPTAVSQLRWVINLKIQDRV